MRDKGSHSFATRLIGFNRTNSGYQPLLVLLGSWGHFLKVLISKPKMEGKCCDFVLKNVAAAGRILQNLPPYAGEDSQRLTMMQRTYSSQKRWRPISSILYPGPRDSTKLIKATERRSLRALFRLWSLDINWHSSSLASLGAHCTLYTNIFRLIHTHHICKGIFQGLVGFHTLGPEQVTNTHLCAGCGPSCTLH